MVGFREADIIQDLEKQIAAKDAEIAKFTEKLDEYCRVVKQLSINCTFLRERVAVACADVDPEFIGTWQQQADHLVTTAHALRAALAAGVKEERERCRKIIEKHFGRSTMKSLECTSEVENGI